MNFFHDYPVGSVIFIYSVVRIWSLFVSRRMLNTILRSSAGKKSRCYVQKATYIQRLYGIYIPLVTSYRHKLSKYLAINNVVCASCSVGIVALAVVSAFFTNGARRILEYGSIFTLLFLCTPPLIVSFAQTTWNGGHPHYWFDLESEFIGVNAKVHRRILLDEKKNCILLTPEEFSAKK